MGRSPFHTSRWWTSRRTCWGRPRWRWGIRWATGFPSDSGILSALKRSVTVEDIEYKDLIQTDAAINPGNSGGPLIDIGGHLVGLNSVKMSFTPQGVPTQGIGFAIPATEVKEAVREFMRQGSVTERAAG